MVHWCYLRESERSEDQQLLVDVVNSDRYPNDIDKQNND